MAKKEETKAAAQQTAVVNEDNVMDQIKSGNLMQDKNVQEALSQIEKETDEKKVREAKDMIMVAKYRNAKKLIELRSRRAEERVTKEFLTKSKEVLDKVLAGKMTPMEYKAENKLNAKDEREAKRKIDEELAKNMAELRASYTGRWQYQSEWDWD